MTAINKSATVVRKPGQLGVVLDGELVMMSADSAEYYGLDLVATDIWDRLVHPISVAALVLALLNDYDGDPAVIEADVLRLLNAFAAKGLVEVRA
jgi:hypothetical protein